MAAPLADRIRPQTLDEMVGQKHLLGQNGLLRRIAESGSLPNLIFYGPSGVGKTTAARIIAAGAGKKLYRLNGTTASTGDIKALIADLGGFDAMGGVVIYLDEIQYLNKKQQEGIYSHMVKVCGIGESRAETMVADLMDAQTNPTLAPYAKTGEVHFRVTARACSEEEAEKLMQPIIEEMKKRFGDAVYTTEEEVTLEESVIRLLEEKKMTVTTAESCTGGKLSGRLLNVSGASNVYNEGYITYANASKEKILGVKHETLETYGAVSEQTAAEMALGAAKAAGADAALSVTGIAGPGGGTAEKPVGLVYIGCAVNGEVTVREYRFTGNREKNRDYAVARAITLLREELLKRA